MKAGAVEHAHFVFAVSLSNYKLLIRVISWTMGLARNERNQ